MNPLGKDTKNILTVYVKFIYLGEKHTKSDLVLERLLLWMAVIDIQVLY